MLDHGLLYTWTEDSIWRVLFDVAITLSVHFYLIRQGCWNTLHLTFFWRMVPFTYIALSPVSLKLSLWNCTFENLKTCPFNLWKPRVLFAFQRCTMKSSFQWINLTPFVLVMWRQKERFSARLWQMNDRACVITNTWYLAHPLKIFPGFFAVVKTVIKILTYNHMQSMLG